MGDNLPKAEETLRKGMKKDYSPLLDFTLGGILFQQDKLDEAMASFRKAVERFPSFRRAYRNIGLIAVRQGNYDEAITAFNRMIELGGVDAYSYGLLAFSHTSKQDYQPAEAAYRNALLLQPENVEWRLGLTRCVFKQGKFEDAAALLDVLITQFPDKGDFWLLQAHTFLGMKQPMKAAVSLESLDALGKSTLDSRQTLGDVYLSESMFDLAANAYMRAIDLDPTEPIAKAVRSAEILAARGAPAQARTLVAHLQKVRGGNLAEEDRRRLLKLDARLAMTEGADCAEAAAVLEEIVALDPLDGEALMLLGQHYAGKGEPERAMLAYERAAGMEAFELNARVRQAQILVKQGRYADAIPMLRRAQDIKPREDVARYLEQVERIARGKK